MLAGVIYFPLQAQQKNSIHRTNFSGEWKLNKSKSDLAGKFPVCIFWEGDRVFSKTMKIIEYNGFFTIHVTSSSPEWEPVKKQEKLVFDGKERKATVFGWPRDESTARWSDDDQTMIVNSFKSFYTKGKAPDVKVREVWKLINDGKSLSVQVNAGEDIRKLVYDRQ